MNRCQKQKSTSSSRNLDILEYDTSCWRGFEMKAMEISWTFWKHLYALEYSKTTIY